MTHVFEQRKQNSLFVIDGMMWVVQWDITMQISHYVLIPFISSVSFDIV